MSVSPRIQAWADRTRTEPLRVCNWPRIRQLALVIALSMLTGLVAEFALDSKLLANLSYSIGALACFGLILFGFNTRFYVSKPPSGRHNGS